MSVTLTNRGLARVESLEWVHRGKRQVTVVAQAGYRLEGTTLVPDSTAYCSLEGATVALPRPEVLVTGKAGWLRMWRGGKEVIMDKSAAGGLDGLPPVAPDRVARLGGRAAPPEVAPQLAASFDFAYYQAAREDQQLDHILAGDVIAIYEGHDPIFSCTIPPEVAAVTGTLAIPLRRDRVYIDTDRKQCTICFRGWVPLDAGDHALTVSLGAPEPTASAPDATMFVGEDAPPPPSSSSEAVQATMAIEPAPASAPALPFAAQLKARITKKSGPSFAELRKGKGPVNTAPVDSTMGIGPPPGPPPPVIVPPKPAPKPAPSSPGLVTPPGAVGPPPMIGEIERPPDKLEIAAAPKVEGELDIQMTALPVGEAPEPPSTPDLADSAPEMPTTPASPAAKKTKKKDVRGALLRKMRRK